MSQTTIRLPWSRIAHTGLASWAGLSYGLGIARLLYETDPLRLAVLGGPGPSLLLSLLGVVAALFLLRCRVSRAPWALPAALVWIYILAAPLEANPLRGILLIGGAVTLSLALNLRQTPRRWVGATMVAALALLAYLLTLQRSVGRADTFEFQVTAPVLGVAHPTGYPLYILIGKLFSLIPLGMVATRVNLSSLVAATLAVLLVYEILRRALTIEWPIAALAALAFGFSPLFWSQAVVAEVYTLHNAFVAALLGAALWLLKQAETGPGAVPDAAQARQPILVIALFALSGFSLSNHLTTVLLLPALAAAILLVWPRLTGRQWALAGGLFLAGLLIYAYIPLRWPALHDGRPMPFDQFIAWITGSRFGGALQLHAWLDDPERWRILWRLLRDQYGWPGLVLSLGGLALLIRRHWRAALVTGLAFAAYAFYGLNYLVPDIGVFLIPLYLIMAVWMGYGVGAALAWLSDRLPAPHPAWIRAAALSAFALLPLSLAWTVGAGFDWSDERRLEAWGREVLSLPLAEQAVILVDSEKIAPLEYLHRIEGLRPDVSVVVLGREQDYYDFLYASLAEGRVVYLQRFLPGLEGSAYLRSLGPLVEVGTEALTEAPSLLGESFAWQNDVTLLGYQLDTESIHPGDEAGITLAWQAQQPVEKNFQVRIGLVDASGQVAWESAAAYPVDRRYPPVAWKGREIVPDYHTLPIPYTLPPGDYAIRVTLLPPFATEPLPLVGGDRGAELGTLRVEPGPGRLPIAGQRVAIHTPGGALTGVDAPPRAPAGGQIELVLGWATHDGDVWTENTFGYGEAAQTLAIPGAGLRLGMQPASVGDGEVLRWSLLGEGLRCGWLRSLSNTCLLAETRIEGEAAVQAVANFDNQLLLVGVDFEVGRLIPGESVTVTLEWQSLRRMDQDYTIFVHLLGPDGLLHGQIDQWPVQGTFPTSAWQPSERVIDRYQVPLDHEAPPGSYQLEIGIYLLSTNERLPVLNMDGIPVDDKVLLDGLIVPP